jgi:hypothetical protein
MTQMTQQEYVDIFDPELVFQSWNSLSHAPSSSLNYVTSFSRGIYKSLQILKDFKVTLSASRIYYNFKFSRKLQRKLFKERRVTGGVNLMNPQFTILIYWVSSIIDSATAVDDQSRYLFPNDCIHATFRNRMIFVDT